MSQSFQGEDAIAPGLFWLSNVHEILSFVCVAESDILQGLGPGADGAGRDFDWDDYERLVGIVKHDLDSLEYNICASAPPRSRLTAQTTRGCRRRRRSCTR